MRILTMFAAGLSLAACATAVADSLDRRGVDAGAMLVERASEARGAALRGQDAFDKAAAALAAIDGLDGAALSRQAGAVRAAGAAAALAAQDVRLATDTMEAASGRYFRAKEDELALMTGEQNRAAAEQALAADAAAHQDFRSTIEAATLRASPALSLYDAEATALRNAPTSGVAAGARASERAAAVAAATEAAKGLGAAVAAGDRFLADLK